METGCVGFEGECGGSTREVPHHHSSVLAPGDEPWAVRVKGQAVDHAGMASKDGGFLCAIEIPYSDGRVFAAGGQRRAIWTDGQSVDRAGVATQNVPLFSAGNVPEDY